MKADAAMEQAPAKKVKLIAQLRALNEQFAEWIQDQLVNHREDVWLDGVEDYIEHAKNLLTEAADSDSPVSGLTDDRAQPWMNGQRAEAHAEQAHDAKLQGSGSAYSAAGTATGMPGIRSSSTEPQSSSATASGQFAFPSFSMPPGNSATAAAAAALLSSAPVLSGSSKQLPSAATSQAALLPPLFSEGASTAPVSFGWGSSSSSSQPAAAEKLSQPSGGLFSIPAGGGIAAPFAFGAGALGTPSASGASAAATPSFPAASTPAASSSLFGQATGPSASNGGLPSFFAASAGTANPGSKPPGISWAANGGAANGSGAAGEAGDEEAAEEDEPKAELQLGDDSTLLFKEPAKLYFKDKDGVGWDDRGKGTLTVRRSKGSDDGIAGLTNIVFTMESGRIIVNGSVYKGLKTQKLKSPKMVCMNLTLAADGGAQEADPKPQTVMFNVGAVEKSERFCTIVEQSIPK